MVVVFRGVADVAEDAHQHDGDRAGEVQLLPGDLQDVGGVVQVAADVVGGAGGAAERCFCRYARSAQTILAVETLPSVLPTGT